MAVCIFAFQFHGQKAFEQFHIQFEAHLTRFESKLDRNCDNSMNFSHNFSADTIVVHLAICLIKFLEFSVFPLKIPIHQNYVCGVPIIHELL